MITENKIITQNNQNSNESPMLDDTQPILNTVEHLPMFTQQITSDLNSGCDTEKLARQLLALHHQLEKLSEMSLRINYVRLSQI